MNVKLSNTRLAFPNLFTPQASLESGISSFGASFLFAPGGENETLMNEAIEAVGKEKWGAKWPAMHKMLKTGLKLCMRDGDTKAQWAGFEGNLFVSASSTRRPELADRLLEPLVEADGKPYSGCYVNAFIDVWPMENKYGTRVCATLLAVQFVKDGDSFGSVAVLPANSMVALTDEDNMDDLV